MTEGAAFKDGDLVTDGQYVRWRFSGAWFGPGVGRLQRASDASFAGLIEKGSWWRVDLVKPASTDPNGLPLHNRREVEGRGICDECSYAAHDYVLWPCRPTKEGETP